MTAPTLPRRLTAKQRRAEAQAARHGHRLTLVREGSVAPYIEATPIRSPRDVFRYMEAFADAEPCEVFWCLALNAQHMLIGDGPLVVSRGILTSSLVHPREVFRACIVAGAAAVILVHNHPSGDPTPSADDRLVTEQLVAAGKLLDIPVHDHVIMGRGRYTSFAEAGLL